MRILLAEDDDMIAEALTGSLKDAGYAADRVADGIAADSALRAQQYDLLLLDLGLPRRDASAPCCAVAAATPAPC